MLTQSLQPQHELVPQPSQDDVGPHAPSTHIGLQ